MPSDVRVFVQWKDPAVFAGEDVECTLTFRNLTALSSHSPSSPAIPRSPRTWQAAEHGHQVSLSLNNSTAPASRRKDASRPSQSRPPAASNKHQRSLSIVSLGGTDSGLGKGDGSVNPLGSRPGRNHIRAASLQVLPKWMDLSSPTAHRPPPRHSPLLDHPSRDRGRVISSDATLPSRPVRRVSTQTTPSGSLQLQDKPAERAIFPSNFKFPADNRGKEQYPEEPTFKREQFSTNSSLTRPTLPHQDGHVESNDSSIHLAPMTSVLSGSSVNGSNRSSGEFYSLSNNSSETLGSEYVAPLPRHLLGPAVHRRNLSTTRMAVEQRSSETLLMGYAQVSASFTLDGSLVNSSAFEEVKRKGVVGGHGGGGVVGIESTRKNNGLLGALGWGNIGDSIGGLLNGGELSSIKEMRDTANSRAIPLLSTPQSLLFVDLKLAPGESKGYRFKFTLPPGLPASHRGKSIKITYNLVIGTQRAGGMREAQSVRRVNIPFRVFSGGEILGHDLMYPHILLRDQAQISPLEKDPLSKSSEKQNALRENTEASAKEFLSYVNSILESKSRQNSASGFLSPTDPSFREFSAHARTSVKESINLAILRSNQPTTSNRSSNRFEISRNGCRIANVVLDRGSHRLGESVTAVIEFRDAEIPCYSLNATLETSEKINPAIAVRSSTSINRVTRRVYASHSSITLFSTRTVFNPTIPMSATPTILTSGVSLDWYLRFEFSTTKVDTSDVPTQGVELLERIARDERGSVLAAAEVLPCETFEVIIPLTVYGDIGDPVSEEAEGLPI